MSRWVQATHTSFFTSHSCDKVCVMQGGACWLATARRQHKSDTSLLPRGPLRWGQKVDGAGDGVAKLRDDAPSHPFTPPHTSSPGLPPPSPGGRR